MREEHIHTLLVSKFEELKIIFTPERDASSGIRIHSPSIQAGEYGSCLRPCGHYDGRN
jgi:hypothetical protein